jgi:competence CoiA-like predicted nuclease
MPLRATLNNKPIFAFHYNNDSWEQLRSQSVVMACCGTKAVLKRSKLGTLFFAHYRHGECDSPTESPEHIYLKNLVAKRAFDAGWSVATEQEGKTPSGEKWIADVFCEKGKSKFIIEIQWSNQTRGEFFRRQEKYDSSKIRALWLYRLKGNKKYHIRDLPYGYSIPVFGIRKSQSESLGFDVPQFDESLECFIDDLLEGKLNWNGEKRSLENTERARITVVPEYIECPKCGKSTRKIIGIINEDLQTKKTLEENFHKHSVREIILGNFDESTLRQSEIGPLVKKRSKITGKSDFHNSCIHCNSVIETIHSLESLKPYMNQNPRHYPTAIVSFPTKSENVIDNWCLDGRTSKEKF